MQGYRRGSRWQSLGTVFELREQDRGPRNAPGGELALYIKGVQGFWKEGPTGISRRRKAYSQIQLLFRVSGINFGQKVPFY